MVFRKRNFRKRPVRRMARKNASKSFVKKVQKIIHADVETKQGYTAMVPTNFNSGIDAAGDAIRVLPQIAQSVAENGRVGNQIKGQKLTLTGAVSWSPSIGGFGTFANARLGVRVFIIQPRQYSNVTDVLANTATWMPQLLQKGGVNTGFTGQINDLWAPLNSDGFIKYYDKVFYLTGTYQATAVGMTQLIGATKIFKAQMKLRNKTLKYDTVLASLSPTNYAPVFCIGYAHMDGSGPDTLSTGITVQWDAVLDYEDA